MGKGPNDEGLSRHHLIRACEASLKRLRTDVIDLYYLHEWDGMTPLEETLDALDTLVEQGKVRYVGCSNYSGWHIMKALGISDRERRPRFVTQQIHYTLEAREAEYELLPIAVDQGLGVLVWSPLAGGLLSGKHRRNQATPEGTRQLAGWSEPPIRDEDRLWHIVDVLVEIAAARGVSAAQVALAWLLGRPAVTSLVIGGRTEAQFKDNIARGRTEADRRRARQARRGQPAAAALSLLAPAMDRARPFWRSRQGDGPDGLSCPFSRNCCAPELGCSRDRRLQQPRFALVAMEQPAPSCRTVRSPTAIR